MPRISPVSREFRRNEKVAAQLQPHLGGFLLEFCQLGHQEQQVREIDDPGGNVSGEHESCWVEVLAFLEQENSRHGGAGHGASGSFLEVGGGDFAAYFFQIAAEPDDESG